MAPSRLSPDPPASGDALGLTPNQLDTYHRNGYLIIPNFLSRETVDSLLAETHHLLSTVDLQTHPLTKFSTGEGSNPHIGDDYFLTSHDQIRFFFEEDAFAPPSPAPSSADPPPAPTLLRPPAHSINKIGHYLHGLSPPFRRTTLTSRHAAIASSLGFRDPRVLQSMVICKQSRIGGAVPPHQDSTFLYTDPPSAVGWWVALEDATRGNGALGFVRGSQKRCGVGRRFVRVEEDGGGTGFVDVEGGRFPEGEGWDGEGEGEGEGEYTIEECAAGTLVLIHGNVLHASERNTSGKSRFVYTFHVIEGESVYDERNWLRPPAGGFTRLSEAAGGGG